jgi:hypothetical protein
MLEQLLVFLTQFGKTSSQQCEFAFSIRIFNLTTRFKLVVFAQEVVHLVNVCASNHTTSTGLEVQNFFFISHKIWRQEWDLNPRIGALQAPALNRLAILSYLVVERTTFLQLRFHGLLQVVDFHGFLHVGIIFRYLARLIGTCGIDGIIRPVEGIASDDKMGLSVLNALLKPALDVAYCRRHTCIIACLSTTA